MIVCNFVLWKGHLTDKTARQGILNFRVDGRMTRKSTLFVPRNPCQAVYVTLSCVFSIFLIVFLTLGILPILPENILCIVSNMIYSYCSLHFLTG